MTLRCSNGLAFLVLEPEPSFRTGIRVDIFEGDNPLSLIARLPLTWGRRWTDPLKGTGSGEFWLHASDEVLTANPDLLAYGNFARFSLDERYRFAIQIEHLDRVQVKTGGDVARTIKVSGRGAVSKLEEAVLYPAGGLTGDPLRAFTDANADDLLGLAFDEAQARGALAGLTRDFTAATDSQNAPYETTLTLEERAGVSVLRIAERLGELAGDVYMTPAGVLRFVNNRGIDRSQQTTEVGPVILQPADNLTELTRSEDGAVRNLLLIETPAGFLERTEGGSVSTFGRREAFLSLGNISDGDAVTRASDAVFAQSADPSAQVGAEVLDKDGARPYVDWGVGDWVLAPDENDQLERHRVRALTVSETKEGRPVFVPELATITEELEDRLERWLAAMAKGTVGGTAGSVAEPVNAPVEVTEAIDAGIGEHVAVQPHFDEFADLVDVDLAGVNAGDLIQYNGSDWVPLDGTEEGDMLHRTDAGLWVPVTGTKATGKRPTIQADGSVAWETPSGGGGGGGFDPFWEGAEYTDLGMSDEFDAANLAGSPWTPVGITSGSVNLLQGPTGPADSVYDLASLPGALLCQIRQSDPCGFRADDVLADGEEICIAFGMASPGTGSGVWRPIFGLNDNDTDIYTGNEIGMTWNGPSDDRLLRWESAIGTPEANEAGPNGRFFIWRLIRNGSALWAYFSNDGQHWSYVMDRSPAMVASHSNVWWWFDVGAFTQWAPVVPIYWIRHTAYTGYRPEWAQ